MICSDQKEFDKVCGRLYEETPEIEYIFTRSELAITLLLGALYSALSIEEEISWVDGKIGTPPTKARYKLSAEDVERINNLFGGSNNDHKKVLLDKDAVNESDKKLNVKIDRYNKHAQSILLNQSAKDRIKPLENLLILMERENKSLLSYKLCVDVSWTDIDDNGNLIYKRGTSDYQRYQYFINRINLRHLFDYELHNEEKAPKSFAELELMFLYCSLKTELQNSREEAMLYGNIDNEEMKHHDSRDKHGMMCHFSMPDSEAKQQHWDDVYSRLIKKEWLRSNETESGDWVYAVCGKGFAPQKPMVWHGSNAALAYIVRTYLNGNWDVARAVFHTKDGKELPKSFKTTQAPAKKVCDAIDAIFKKH